MVLLLSILRINKVLSFACSIDYDRTLRFAAPDFGHYLLPVFFFIECKT